MAKTGKYTGWNFCLRLAIYKPYPYYKVKIRIFATGQAVYLLVAQPPNPFSQNFILRLRTVPALFLPSPAEIFCKRRGWLTSIIANCTTKGNGIFSKIRQARRTAASVKRCSKGLGCFPTSKTCGFQHRRKPQFLLVGAVPQTP